MILPRAQVTCFECPSDFLRIKGKVKLQGHTSRISTPSLLYEQENTATISILLTVLHEQENKATTSSTLLTGLTISVIVLLTEIKLFAFMFSIL